MGRLFWKFFLSILLAQVAATVGIGGTFWLKDRARQQKAADLDTSPPARMAIDAAAATLEFGGSAALRSLIKGMERHHVLAVDDSGQDLLGRAVNPVMLAEARALAERNDAPHVARKMTGADGRAYLLFLPSGEHGPRFKLGLAEGPGLFEPHGPPRFADDRPPPSGGRPDGAANAGQPAAPGAQSDAPPAPREPPPEPHGNPRYRAFIPLAAGTLASLLFAFLLAWYFSRPIRDLRLAFAAAAGGDLAPRFANSGKRRDELSDLGREFDHMTGRLRSLIDGQTRLLHDVSHELRSPLARLQAAIGLAHQRPDKVAASLERIERESVRMDKLVGELLTLSRLEAGALSAASEELCIADLVDEIVADARFEASARGVTIDADGALDAHVCGQPDLLGRALENVVRNAVKHSPDGGAVQLELATLDAGRKLRIVVSDRGPGVPADDLQAIFEPFFRSAAQDCAEGHGLGLAIARHVIQAHGGGIAARNREGGGLCVEIVLPTAPHGAAL
jgi:two-component system, OmpR family, sensor kinase